MQQLKTLMMELQAKSGLGCDESQHTKNLSPMELEEEKARWYNESVGNLNERDGYDCPLCKNKGDYMVVGESFGVPSQALMPCKCQKARRAIMRLNKSGLKNIMRDYTFDKYETVDPWQETIKAKAIQFLKDSNHDWFFIGGQSGAGKTHICTAIAVQYIRDGREVKYMLWRDEITQIKSVVNEHDKYTELMDALKKTDVLYIDDLFKSGKGEDGKPKMPTAADVNVAFEILNYRYNNPGLITIISSERTLSELLEIDEAVAGRIAEKSKAGGYCLNLKKDKSRNWRMRGCDEI